MRRGFLNNNNKKIIKMPPTGTSSSISSSILSFREKLENRIRAVSSILCIGLDPHANELQNNNNISSSSSWDDATDNEKCNAAYEFCKRIIINTTNVAACYKPNIAFFEALGIGGDATLQRVLKLIPSDIPILLDAKRGDIGTTAQAYATAAYNVYNADAITLSPFMGYDSIEPFLSGPYADKGAFVLCKTSNPGSNDFLALDTSTTGGSKKQRMTLYERVAETVQTEWIPKLAAKNNSKSSTTKPFIGLVIGATDPVAIQNVRTVLSKSNNNKKSSTTSTSTTVDEDLIWILAPGIGAQGGDAYETISAGIIHTTGMGLLIPVSRAISQAPDIALAAEIIRKQIEEIRMELLLLSTVLKDAFEEEEERLEQEHKQQKKQQSLQPYQTKFLSFAIDSNVLQFGSFVLKSGRTSPYFFNAGLFSSGQALSVLGTSYASTIVNGSYQQSSTISASSTSNNKFVDDNNVPNFDVIFGPAYKGIPLGAVVCSALYNEFNIDVGYAYNRKEAKDHGEGGILVGTPLNGKRVLIIDDVITAGTAIREVYTILHNAGAIPVGVIIALDRAEKRSLDDPVSAVQAVIRDLSLPVLSIVTLYDLQAYIEQRP